MLPSAIVFHYKDLVTVNNISSSLIMIISPDAVHLFLSTRE